MTSLDTNVSNYTLSELLSIVGITNEDINEDIVLNNKDLSLKDTIEKVVKKLNHGIKLRDDITMLGIDLKN